MKFRDRVDAGRQLAAKVEGLGLEDPVVLALPRGGVPVAFEIATALGAPLDVIVARKIGAPSQPELGIGAIAEGNEIVIDRRAIRLLGISEDRLAALTQTERRELDRRVDRYRHGRALTDVRHRDVVLVDDGLATGVTAEVTLRALRAREPRRLVLAVPVCAPDTADRLRDAVDDLVCVMSPARFFAVGAWYDNFEQTSDEQVDDLLQASTTSGA